MTQPTFPYRWTLADAQFSADKGKVFSCFACGGGSSMGYKLAGFDVIGCNEIDPRVNDVYVKNLHPKYNYCEPIQTFRKRKDFPRELYHLDILDGSYPCSTFSLAGDREKAWNKKKKFREGQEEQELDKLAFEFIALAKELQPKVMVSENVVGLIQGNAKAYMRKIIDEMYRAGFIPQIFEINAQDCGVPQSRPRVFIIGLREDLAHPFMRQVSLFDAKPYIDLSFHEKHILFKEVCDYKGWLLPDGVRCYWDNKIDSDRCVADTALRTKGKNTMFNLLYVRANQVCPTLPARMSCLIHWEHPSYLSTDEVKLVSSFPMDYDFGNQKPHYICGMCVPPVVMANVATRIYDTWLQYI